MALPGRLRLPAVEDAVGRTAVVAVVRFVDGAVAFVVFARIVAVAGLVARLRDGA